MKKLLLLSALAVFALSGCKKYKNKEVYANCPIYMSDEEFDNSFEFRNDVQMVQTGNIHVFNSWIFVSEEDKGIHVVDNQDPYNPYPIGFMNIVGNTDIAVQGSYLYANSVMDLLVIDISNINDPKLVHRVEDVFDYATPALEDPSYPVADVDRNQGIVIGWEIKKTKDVSGVGAKYFVKDCPECEDTDEQLAQAKIASRSGLAGSMSKFIIEDGYLYTINNNSLITFSLSNPQVPNHMSSDNTWREAETLFPYEDYLFVGTTTGMIIYDRSSNPDRPKEISEIDHTEACDPVVVQGDYAYVTLRSGNDCGQTVNELQLIDISNIRFPWVRKTFDMTNPHGLGVDGDLLFICDGEDGLKVFDNEEPKKVGDNIRYQFHNVHARDVILNDGVLVLVGDDGVSQYDYSNPNDITFMSLLTF